MDKLTLSTNFSGRRCVKISKLHIEKEVLFWPFGYVLFFFFFVAQACATFIYRLFCHFGKKIGRLF